MTLPNVDKCQRGRPWEPGNIGKAGIRRYCRICRRMREKEKYTPERGRGYRKQFYSQRRITRKDLIQKLKSVPCADCGQTYPYYVMDFDHARGQKKYNISLLRSGSSGLATFLAEVAKCDVVCSNCHRVRTYVRKLDSPSGGVQLDESAVAHHDTVKAGSALRIAPRTGPSTEEDLK